MGQLQLESVRWRCLLCPLEGPGPTRPVAAAAGGLRQARSSCQAANTAQTHRHTSRGEKRAAGRCSRPASCS